jgi:hypothetical protein
MIWVESVTLAYQTWPVYESLSQVKDQSFRIMTILMRMRYRQENTDIHVPYVGKVSFIKAIYGNTVGYI